MRSTLAAIAVLALAGCTGTASTSTSALPPRLEDLDSGTEALLIAAHALDGRTVWVSGTGGTVLRTVDRGATWTGGTVPGADTLQFRDVVPLGEDTALALSIGNGAASRIVRTTDGGGSWETVWVNDDPDAFFDCLSFWDRDRGIAFSDAVDGRFVVIATADGGDTWSPIEAEGLAAPEGAGGFAASGTCVATRGTGTAWIATGNSDRPGVLRTDDGGTTWAFAPAPVVAGEAKGLASVAFRDGSTGVAVGGDLTAPDAFADAVAVSSDGGRTWAAGGRLPFPGAAYGVAYVPDSARGDGPDALVAVGPGGAALSRDDGRTWQLLSEGTFWGVAASGPSAVWLTGPEGRIVRVRL